MSFSRALVFCNAEADNISSTRRLDTHIHVSSQVFEEALTVVRKEAFATLCFTSRRLGRRLFLAAAIERGKRQQQIWICQANARRICAALWRAILNKSSLLSIVCLVFCSCIFLPVLNCQICVMQFCGHTFLSRLLCMASERKKKNYWWVAM